MSLLVRVPRLFPTTLGDLGQYMDSLRRLLELDLETIYPRTGQSSAIRKRRSANTSRIRELRERQILAALADGPLDAMAIVRRFMWTFPSTCICAANSVRSHLKKLERESRVMEHEKRWSIK